MEIRKDSAEGALIVAVAGRVDSVTSGELESMLLPLAAVPEARLVVDMQEVEYISSAGLRVFLRLVNKLKESRGELVLCSLAESVREVFELAGFMAIFAVEASRPSALARLSGLR